MVPTKIAIEANTPCNTLALVRPLNQPLFEPLPTVQVHPLDSGGPSPTVDSQLATNIGAVNTSFYIEALNQFPLATTTSIDCNNGPIQQEH